MIISAESIRNRLVRDSAWVLAGKIGTFPVWIAVNFFLARLLAPKELGAYFLAASLAATGGAIAQLGTERTVVRLVSAALVTGLSGRARAAVRTVFRITALGALALVGFLELGGGRWLAHVFGSQALSEVMIIVAAWLAAFAFQDLLTETFRGFQDFKLATLFEALLVHLVSAGVFGALWVMRRVVPLSQVLLISAGVSVGTVLLAAWLLRRRLHGMARDGRVPAREALTISLPLLVTNVSTFIPGTGVDLWVLGAFRSQQEVALCGAAVRLVFFLLQPFVIIQSVTPPIIAEMYAQGRRKELEGTLRAAATLAGFPAFLLLLVFLLFGGTVMGALFGPFYRKAASILAILSLSRMWI
jgi:O-antigen/teichoic acid export membrane protein